MESIDDYKDEYRSLGEKPLATFPNGEQHLFTESLIRALKKQDDLDRNYLLYRKILPVSIGLVLMTIVFILTYFPNTTILMGSLFIFIGLVAILALFLRDFMVITNKDGYGLPVVEYLKEKRRRIHTWKRIPLLYILIYCLYIVGVSLLILGNTGLDKILNESGIGIFLYTAIIIGALIISGIVGGWKYRRRFKKEHLPLIQDITQLLDALKNEDDS